jgi:hypothetical protein
LRAQQRQGRRRIPVGALGAFGADYRQKTGIFPEFPRFGFALCLPLLIGYDIDSRTVTGFGFRSSGLLLGKLLCIFASVVELTHGY